MPSTKFTETYEKISKMGTRLKDAGKQGPSNDEQLELYALAKVANGADFSAAKKPGMFDLAGKAKYAKWKELSEKDTSQADAEQEYITKGEAILAKYDN